MLGMEDATFDKIRAKALASGLVKTDFALALWDDNPDYSDDGHRELPAAAYRVAG